MRHLISFGMVLLEVLCAQAQWPRSPLPGAPRTPDGKVNMTGPAPRSTESPIFPASGRSRLSPALPGGLFGLGESPNSKYFRDILLDFKRGRSR